MKSGLAEQPGVVDGNGWGADGFYCPECGQPLDQTRRRSQEAASRRPIWSSGLVVVGLLLFALVGLRSWTAETHLATVERRAATFGTRFAPTGLAPDGISVMAGSEEEVELLSDLVRTRNRLREGPIGALLAALVVVAGVGIGECSPVTNSLMLQNGLTRAARRTWQVARSVSLVVALMFASLFSVSAIELFIHGVEFTPLLLEAAFSKAVSLALDLPNLPTP